MKFARSFVNVNPVLKSFYGAIVFSSPAAEEGKFKNAEDNETVHFLNEECCAAKGKVTYNCFLSTAQICKLL